MINEIFLQSAVEIRRRYLNISKDVEVYHKHSKEIITLLENSMRELNELKERNVGEDKISEVLSVLNKIEDESNRLEKLMVPINADIESLSKEEKELYRQIKEKHPKLSDDEIFNLVQERLIKEGLA